MKLKLILGVMKRIRAILLYICVAVGLYAQQVDAQKTSVLPTGFPDRSPQLDVLPGFQHPPKGYG